MMKRFVYNIDILAFLLLFILSVNYLFFVAMTLTESSFLIILMRLLSIALLILIFFIKKVNIIYMPFLVTLGYFVFLMNGNVQVINLIFIVLLIFLFKNMKIEVILKFIFIVSICMIVLHFLIVELNLTSANSQFKYQVGDRIRFTFGFANPNSLAIFYASIFYSTFYYYSLVVKKFSIFAFLVILIALVMMYLSGSRTQLYTSVFFVFFTLIPYKLGALKLFFRLILTVSPFIFTILSLIIAFQHDSIVVNEILSLRPILFFEFLSQFDEIYLFTGLKYTAESPIDNAYILLFAACGLPLYTVIITLLSYQISKSRVEFFPFILIVLVSSMFESFLIRPEFLISMLFYAFVFSDHKNRLDNR